MYTMVTACRPVGGRTKVSLLPTSCQAVDHRVGNDIGDGEDERPGQAVAAGQELRRDRVALLVVMQARLDHRDRLVRVACRGHGVTLAEHLITEGIVADERQETGLV